MIIYVLIQLTKQYFLCCVTLNDSCDRDVHYYLLVKATTKLCEAKRNLDLLVTARYVVKNRAVTNIQFVWIFIRTLVFGFDSFAFGIRLYGILVKIIYCDTD